MKPSVNTLFNADCLAVLERMDSEQVTLAYLDPPWNINPGNWSAPEGTPETLTPYTDYIVRVLLQVRRVLSCEGTLYFHSSPYTPLYSRLILDQVFGERLFQTEIILPHTVRPYSSRPTATHSSILVYSKADSFVHTPQFREYTPERLAQFRQSDEKGPYRLVALTMRGDSASARADSWKGYRLPPERIWRYSPDRLEQLDQQGLVLHGSPTDRLPRLKAYLESDLGTPVGSIWDDVMHLRKEDRQPDGRVYFAQQPLALLDRIVASSTYPEQTILDPFCGSGTALVSAQRHDRRWIGADTSPDACDLARKRLSHFVEAEGRGDFRYVGKGELETNSTIVAQPYRDLMVGFRDYDTAFVLGQPVVLEEIRNTEFKQITSQKPVKRIRNTADEYAVAYLNDRQGGSIYWGISNSGIVQGVHLRRADRDTLQRVVIDKLCCIHPSVVPSAFSIKLHPVYRSGAAVQDLRVVELRIPPTYQSVCYSTASGDVFVKTDAGKKKLSSDELEDWMYRLSVEDPVW